MNYNHESYSEILNPFLHDFSSLLGFIIIRNNNFQLLLILRLLLKFFFFLLLFPFFFREFDEHAEIVLSQQFIIRLWFCKENMNLIIGLFVWKKIKNFNQSNVLLIGRSIFRSILEWFCVFNKINRSSLEKSVQISQFFVVHVYLFKERRKHFFSNFELTWSNKIIENFFEIEEVSEDMLHWYL